MMSPEERLYAYEVDVQFPDVSGMEHIEMFYNRSELAEIEDELLSEQKEHLARADQILLRDAHLFNQALKQIVNLKKWREKDNRSAAHWWWYLDVVVSLPTMPLSENEAGMAEQSKVVETM